MAEKIDIGLFNALIVIACIVKHKRWRHAEKAAYLAHTEFPALEKLHVGATQGQLLKVDIAGHAEYAPAFALLSLDAVGGLFELFALVDAPLCLTVVAYESPGYATAGEPVECLAVGSRRYLGCETGKGEYTDAAFAVVA